MLCKNEKITFICRFSIESAPNLVIITLMKRLIPIVMTLCVYLLSVSGCKREKLEKPVQEISVVPADSTETTETPTEESGEENENVPDGTEEPAAEETDIFRALTNGVLRGEKEVLVKDFRIPAAKADSVYNAFLRSHPLLFHLKVGGNIGYREDLKNPGYLAAFLPQYAVSPAALPEIYPGLEESVENFYALLDHRMSQAEIAYTLYQKVCNEVVYGERNEDFSNLAYASFSALGVFLTHKAVCQGYSLSYSLLMNGLGIPTDYVTGAIPGSSGHAWNRIYLDGNWYHADATFDDASTYKMPGMGSINKYFLCSDDLFYSAFAHPKPHLNLPERIYVPSGNKFDSEKCVVRWYNAKGEAIKTETRYADGYWYYQTARDGKKQILKSDFCGQQAQVIRQLQMPSVIEDVDRMQYTRNRIYFIDYLNGNYVICSMDYDGNDFRQEKKISYIDAVTPQLKLSQDDSSPVPVCKGMIALKAETMLARLRLLYCHGDDDYFELSQPQAKELEALVKKADELFEKPMDEAQADGLAKEMRAKRKAYSVPCSVRP